MIYGTSGLPFKLPLGPGDPGHYTLTAAELLSGLSGKIQINSPGRQTSEITPAGLPNTPGRAAYSTVSTSIPGVSGVATSQVGSRLARAGGLPLASTNGLAPGLSQFSHRNAVPLVIALTPEQAQDPVLRNLADRLLHHFRIQRRTVAIDTIEPGRVVRSLQPQKPTQRYPQWKTLDADLVLFGTPRSSILLLDQARGYLLPAAIEKPLVQVTYSPFVGEYNTLNILAGDTAGLEAAAKMLLESH